MQSLLQDLRFGMRTLRKSPLFASAVVLVLGLGIGANTIIFTAVNSLVFRPLPYRNPKTLVSVMAGREPLRSWGGLSYPDYQDYRAQNQVVDSLAALLPSEANLTGMAEPERLRCLTATVEAAPLLGLRLKIGRPFLERECAAGAEPAVILSHGFWQRRFGSNSDILGKTLTLDGTAHSVIGVFEPEARMGLLLGFEPDVWMPLAPPNQPQRGLRNLLVMARLKPGVSLERAQGNLSVIARRLEGQYPASNDGWRVLVSEVIAKVDPIAYVLLSLLVSSILGIACMNAANLILSRTSGRAREIAIREALGAGRPRIMRQLLTESSLLGILGGCLGLLIAYGACALIQASGAGSNLELVDLTPDARVLAATLIFLVISVVGIGLAPAIKLTGKELVPSLKEGGTGSHGGDLRNRLGGFLTASEIALSLVLLAGGCLALKSWSRLWHVDPGYHPDGVLAVRLSLTEPRFSERGHRIEFFENLLSRLEGRTGIRSAGVSSALPTRGPQAPFKIPGRLVPSYAEEPAARCTSAGLGYFETMAIPVKAGRMFLKSDRADSMPVALVNENLARKYWSGRDALGMQIELRGERRTIVGIVGDLREAPLAMKPQPEIYLPYDQNPESHVTLVVKTDAEPAAIAAVLKQEIHALEPNQPVEGLQAMDTIRGRNMGVIRLGSRLLGILGLGALILAAVGLFGLLSYNVSQRTAEFGIRMALGARPPDVLALVLRQGIRLSLFGIAPGLAAALLLTRALSRTMYGVQALEPLILLGLALVLGVVALLACYVPARRATRADPIVALRSE